MKKQFLILGLVLVTILHSYSQINFESGYFINEADQKVECLIRNIDWRNNPTEFEYMLSQNANIQKASIESVKEFGINGASKFIRSNVKIDRSSDELKYMSSERNPIFQEEQLYLKVLVEGKASLFLYENDNFTRFFFNISDSITSQLVYKRYFISQNKIARNDFFRQQLLKLLSCQTITMKDINNINYTKRELGQLFIKYNVCTNSEYVDYESMKTNDLFSLSIRPGINSSNLTIQNSASNSFDTDFGNKFGFRVGVDVEFFLPFNKNKWGIIIEPTYQYYESESSKEVNNVSGGIQFSKVNYRSIELPIGLRHHFYLNDNSKFFANISLVLDFSGKSHIEFTRSNGTILKNLEVKSRRNLALGVGYQYMNRYSIEIRQQTGREILGNYISWSSNYKTLSLIIGYSIF